MPLKDSLYPRTHLHVEDLVNSPFYTWLLANPDWIAASVLLIAFIESFAIIGVLVPGVFLLYVAAFLAGTGLLALPLTLAMAFLGAVLGDGLSFLLGWKYQDNVRRWPVLRDNTQWMDRGEQFILAQPEETNPLLRLTVGLFLKIFSNQNYSVIEKAHLLMQHETNLVYSKRPMAAPYF